MSNFRHNFPEQARKLHVGETPEDKEYKKTLKKKVCVWLGVICLGGGVSNISTKGQVYEFRKESQ